MADEPNSPAKPLGNAGQSGAPPRVAPKKSFGTRLLDALRKDNVEGDAHVSVAAIIITALFLMLLTVGLLYSIINRWPACDLPEESANSNVAGNTNGNTASPANGNTSAAAGANINTNANSSANVAANTNAGANSNTGAAATNTPANGNVGAGAAAPNATPATAGGATKAGIDANTVEPKSGPVTGKTLVTIRGKNFGTSIEGLKVKFDGVEAKVSKVSDESITARTPPHSEGAVDVRVERSDANYDLLDSEYTYTCPSPTGTNLFYMLIFAGALGSCIHAMRSLFWYVGQRELRWSWLPMYFTLPFIGAAMAMLFGLLIFAGLFDNNTGRSQSLFIIAVAGLVGMFSQQAALKLADIANAIFTKPEPGKEAEPQKGLPVDSGDKNQAAASTAKIDPGSGSVKGDETVKLINVSKVDSVTFGGAVIPVTDADFDKASSTITLKTLPHEEGEVEVMAKDTAGNPVILKYNYKKDETVGS